MAAPPLAGTTETARERPTAPAISDGSQTLTYGQLSTDARALADELGQRSGPVGISLPSGPRLLTAFLAAVLAGRPACVLHGDFAEPERDRALAVARVTDLITDHGVTALHPADEPVIEAAGDDPLFYVGFTSGTSGTPKAFTRRWRSWADSFDAAAALCRVDEAVTVMLPGALQHSHFLFGAVLGLEQGAHLITWERFDAADLMTQLRATERSVVYLVPTMLTAIESELDDGPAPHVTTVVLSGAAQEAHHRAIARRAFPNARIVEIFGASELSFVTIGVDDGDTPTGEDVGTPFPGVTIEIRDPETGAVCAPGTPGEIFVHSPLLFAGYYDADGRLDDRRGADGFLSVGDLGRCDAEHRLTLVGRVSNMVITGGKNVHPEEIEAVLRGQDGVTECVVLGVPDRHWGERLVAIVEAEPDDPAGLTAQLDAAVRAELAAYKAPKDWHFARLPRTGAGKVARDQARQLVPDA